MNTQTFRERRRRGVAMLTAIALLAVVMLIAAGLLRQVVSQQRAVRGHLQQLQADYLAESALGRAAAKVLQNDEYAGEVWQPTCETNGSKQPARVQIEVDHIADAETASITILVRYPANAAASATRQSSVRRTISLAKPKKQS